MLDWFYSDVHSVKHFSMSNFLKLPCPQEKVSLSDISTFLMSVRQEESLGRGTSLWMEVRLKIMIRSLKTV